MKQGKTYRRLVGSPRWAALALRKKTEASWQCSECGTVTKRLAVHHIIPLESAKSDKEMEQLCFQETNLRVLCYPCHTALHKAMRYNSSEMVQERDKQRVHRFFEKFIDNKNGEGSDAKGE